MLTGLPSATYQELWNLLSDPVTVNYYGVSRGTFGSADLAGRLAYYCRHAGGGVQELARR